jgi:hypothetical protein
MCEANPPLPSRIENENPWKSDSTVPEPFMPELFISPNGKYTFVRTCLLEIVLFCVFVPNRCWQDVLHIHSRLRAEEYGNGALESVGGKQKLNYSHKPREQSDYCKVCTTFTNGQILLSVHGSTYIHLHYRNILAVNTNSFHKQPITLAGRSKAWVLIAGIAVSNPAGRMGVRLL